MLSQDFFLKGVEHQSGDGPKKQANDNSTNCGGHASSISNNSQDKGLDFSSLPDRVPASSSSFGGTNISEINFTQNDLNSNRIEQVLKPVVDNSQVKKPNPKTDPNSVTTARDLISDLKSLIFDETSISEHSESCQLNDKPKREENNLSFNESSKIPSSSINSSTKSAINSFIPISPSTPDSITVTNSLLGVSPATASCSDARQNDFVSQPVPGPSNTSCVIVQSEPTTQRTSSTGLKISGQVNSTAQKHPEKRNNSRSARRARRLAAQDKRFATISKLPAIPSAIGDPQQQLQDINVLLPPNWEARLDAHGRVFYIDHERRTTTWHRPKNDRSNQGPGVKVDQTRSQRESRNQAADPDAIGTNATTTGRVEDSTEQQRALLNRRYTLRRTISSRRPIRSLGESIMDVVADQTGSSSHDTPLIDPVGSKSSQSQQAAAILNHDTIDGNCISGSATNRARSYNLCVDQRFQIAASPDPRPGTSQQCMEEQPAHNASSFSANSSTSHNDSASSNQGPSSSARRSLNSSVSCPPALKFLNRSDFFNLLHLNDDALGLYTTSTNLKYIINKVRKDKTNSAFERFQHNKDLVAFLNKFSNKNELLPTGWEMKMDGVGKCFFIDHIRKATTYVDPRLPTEMPLVNPHQVQLYDHRTPASVAAAAAAAAATSTSATAATTPGDGVRSSDSDIAPTTESAAENAPRASLNGAAAAAPISRDPAGIANLVADPLQASTSQPAIVSYEEKIVAFFKQPNIFDIIKERRSASNLLNCSSRERINQIRKGGLNTLKKYSHDVNLMMIISLFDVEIDSINTPTAPSRPVPQIRSSVGRIIIPAKRDFEEKLRYFYKKLEQKSFGQGPNKLKLGIRRDHILEDAFTKVMSVNSKKDLQRSRLYVSFAGEEGLDYGGPSREFFFLLSRELFNPYYGKFY